MSALEVPSDLTLHVTVRDPVVIDELELHSDPPIEPLNSNNQESPAERRIGRAQEPTLVTNFSESEGTGAGTLGSGNGYGSEYSRIIFVVDYTGLEFRCVNSYQSICIETGRRATQADFEDIARGFYKKKYLSGKETYPFPAQFDTVLRELCKLLDELEPSQQFSVVITGYREFTAFSDVVWRAATREHVQWAKKNLKALKPSDRYYLDARGKEPLIDRVYAAHPDSIVLLSNGMVGYGRAGTGEEPNSRLASFLPSLAEGQKVFPTPIHVIEFPPNKMYLSSSTQVETLSDVARTTGGSYTVRSPVSLK